MSWERQVHIKSPAELERMREAGKINAMALAAVKELLQPGVATADLNAAAEDVLRQHGCISPFKGYGHPPFPASITVSINQELVHGIPSKKRKLKAGDIVSLPAVKGDRDFRQALKLLEYIYVESLVAFLGQFESLLYMPCFH